MIINKAFYNVYFNNKWYCQTDDKKAARNIAQEWLKKQKGRNCATVEETHMFIWVD